MFFVLQLVCDLFVFYGVWCFVSVFWYVFCCWLIGLLLSGLFVFWFLLVSLVCWDYAVCRLLVVLYYLLFIGCLGIALVWFVVRLFAVACVGLGFVIVSFGWRYFGLLWLLACGCFDIDWFAECLFSLVSFGCCGAVCLCWLLCCLL